MTVAAPISTSGNVKLIAGWDGNLTSPAMSASAFNYLTTGPLSAANVELSAPWGVTMAGALTATGNLTIRSPSGSVAAQTFVSTAPITYPVHVAGNTDVTAPIGSVTFADTGNQFNGLTIKAGYSVSVNANSSLVLGDIWAPGGLTMSATSAITQPSGTVDTRNATGLGNGGAVSITGSSVALNSVVADGSYSLFEISYSAGAGGNISVNATAGNLSGRFQARGAINGGLDATALNGGAGGNVTLVGTGGTVTLTSTGMDLSGGAGATNGLPGAAGRWLVYADSPAAVSKGGLTSNFRHYSATYANYQGQFVTESGNGFIYASAPGALQVDATLASGSASHVYGNTPDAVFGYTLSGFADSEDTAANIGLAGTASFDHSFLASTNAGSYLQKYASGLSSTLGYTFAAQNGFTYTVNQRPITVSTSAVTKTYDKTTSALGTPVVTVGSMVANDLLSGGTYAFTNANAGAGNKTVSVSGVTVTDGNAGANYLVTYAANTASTITPLAVTLTAPAISKTYDGTTAYTTQAANLTALSGTLIAGDTVTAAGMTYTNKNAGTANKGVTLNSVTLNDGNGGNNYTVTLAGNSISTITPASIALTAPVVSKTYDGTTAYTTAAADLTALSAGLFGGDTVSAATMQFADKNAGAANKAVSLTAATINDGNGGANYTVTALNGNSTSTITQAAVSNWIGGTSGLWSSSANWTALPDGTNVQSVSIPSGSTVTFDPAAASTTLQSISSLGTVAVSGSSLAVTGSLTTANFNQTGGAVSGAGSLTVNNSFSQSAGTIAMGGAVSIRQATGNLTVGSLSGASLTVEAVNGAVSQSGLWATTGLLRVNATNGINLTYFTNLPNQPYTTSTANGVSAALLNNTGTGNVQLVNAVPLDLQGATVANGNLVINNTGGFSNSGPISVTGGTLDIQSHSPLSINSTVTAGGSITLAALTQDVNGTSNITINSSDDIHCRRHIDSGLQQLHPEQRIERGAGH